MEKRYPKNRRGHKLIAAFTAVLTALIVLTGAIAVPLLCRPFYYAHIEPLNLEERSGLTVSQIKETYHEVMDYCLGAADDFALSHLRWSEEGAAHFADVRALFLLDLAVLTVSLFLLVGLWIAARCRNVGASPIKGHTPGFWSAVGLGGTFSVIGVLAAMDFDRAFTAFHTVFFPGKDNWIFGYDTDPVIDILPQVFFRNCALLIGALIVTGCILLIVMDRWKMKKQKGISSAG